MCGRFFVPDDDEFPVIGEMLRELRDKGMYPDTGEVSPGSSIMVLARDRKMEQRPFVMRWGARLPGGKLVFNTRVETAAEKPLFRESFGMRRCAVPASVYYEWASAGDEKQKYAISPEGQAMLWLAALYRIEAGRPVFSILTREPSEQIAFIHDRMPVILPPDIVFDWSDPDKDPYGMLRMAVCDMSFEKIG